MQINHAAFFNGYRQAFGALKPNQVAGFEVLGRNMEMDPALTDARLAAYMLATVKHECANTWQPIVERGARDYFNQYKTVPPRASVLATLSRATATSSAGAATCRSPAAPTTCA